MSLFQRKSSPPPPFWCEVKDAQRQQKHMDQVLEVINNLDQQRLPSHATDIVTHSDLLHYSVACALSWLIKENLVKLTPKGFKLC